MSSFYLFKSKKFPLPPLKNLGKGRKKGINCPLDVPTLPLRFGTFLQLLNPKPPQAASDPSFTDFFPANVFQKEEDPMNTLTVQPKQSTQLVINFKKLQNLVFLFR